MPDSQNGYSVIAREDCTFYDNIVEGLSLPLRPGATGEVLAIFLRRYARRVEPLSRTATFGHAVRQIAGSSTWSNHSSGTAVDANSTDHPAGKTGTYSADEKRALLDLLEEFDGVIRWGGTFSTVVDEMHYEINKDYAEVKELLAELKRGRVVNVNRLLPGKRNLDVLMVKRALRRRGYMEGRLNRYFGKGLLSAYKQWQRSLGYEGSDADGIPGPSSLEALGFTVKGV